MEGCHFTDDEISALKRVAVEHEPLRIAMFGDGNRNVGLIRKVDRILTIDEERERAQQRRHEENLAKLEEIRSERESKSLWWIIAGVLVSVAALGAMIVIAMVGYKVSKQTDFHILSGNSPSYTAERIR